MQTRNYETIFITNSNIPESKIQDIKTRNQQIIESLGGKILQLDDWGKKKMAYAIRKEPKGHYFCLTYTANTECVAELERNLRINEEVYRFLSVKLDEKLDPLAAIASYKLKQEAHAKREKERAERDAERNADRAGGGGGFRGGPRGGDRDRGDRGDRPERAPRMEAPSVVADVADIDVESDEE